MASFQFRLATLLKLRENERRQRQIELGQAMEAERIMLRKAEGIAGEIAAARDRSRIVSSPGEVSIDTLLELQRYVLQLKVQARLAAEQIAQVRTEIERRRQVLVEADRHVRTLEKLRDKQIAAFQAESQRLEQRLLDEMGQRKLNQLHSD